MPDQPQYAIGSELDEFADFVRGLQSSEDGAAAAERVDRWFVADHRAVQA